MKINQKNNLIRIFKIPYEYPKGYCFGGGKDVNFVMVDWFEAYPSMLCPAEISGSEEINEKLKDFPPLLDCPNREIELTQDLREKLNSFLCTFIKKKNYRDGHDLLAITDYGDSFVVKADINSRFHKFITVGEN